MTATLDDLYDGIALLSGIQRTRDPRLEKIAADRALEARFQVGLSGTTGITHPIHQLMARTWPLQGPFKMVLENATWHYYPSSWVDPYEAALDATLPDGSKIGWWNSTPHRTNFQNAEATHIGLGVYSEGGRWYFIAILTRQLMSKAIVATGENFPDAISASTLVDRYSAPILLTRKNQLPPATVQRLNELKPTEILLVGGPGVVYPAVEAALSAIAPVRRVQGVDRYETAVAVSKA